MRVATLRIKHFRSIGRLDPGGDDLTLPIGENSPGRTGVLDDPEERSPGCRPAPRRSRRMMASWEGP